MTASESEKSKEEPTAAARRKRRIALRRQAAVTDVVINDSNKRARTEGDEALVDPVTKEPKASITGIKKMHRYQPGVTMTKTELKEWRKEARRVRNRESAAASRKRNRDRIGELETEAEILKSKYAAALQYIMGLEGGSSSKELFTPETLRQDMKNLLPLDGPVSPGLMPGCAPRSFGAPFSLNMKENHFENATKNQHITMISNIAVKIPGADSSTGNSHVIPPPSTCSDCSTTSQEESASPSSEIATQYGSSSASDDAEESELSEFLFDTFEGFDGLEIEGLPLSI